MYTFNSSVVERQAYVDKETSVEVLSGTFNTATNGLIACRTPSDLDAERLNKLSPRQYETLFRIAQNMSYQEIADEQDTTLDSVENIARKISQKLCISDIFQKSTFIPLEAESLKYFSIYDTDEYGRTKSKLRNREHQIFDLISEGMSDKEIAQELDMTNNTVTRHISFIVRRLGLSGHIQLRRLCGANKNLSVQADTAQSIQKLVSVMVDYWNKDNGLIGPVSAEQVKNKRYEQILNLIPNPDLPYTANFVSEIIDREVEFYNKKFHYVV